MDQDQILLSQLPLKSVELEGERAMLVRGAVEPR